jgi:hypothetical protein
MFSDMAEEGSGGYHAYDDDEDYDMDDMSGSGSHPGENNLRSLMASINFLKSHADTDKETPPIIGVTDMASPKNQQPTGGASTLRISLLATLVLPSFIVILFNKF